MAEFHTVSGRHREGRGGARECEIGVGRWGCRFERAARLLLAVSVLQVEMRVEVDEDLLAGLRRRDHPHALLGGRVRGRVARRGQVVCGVDLYVAPAFICNRNTRKERKREKVVETGSREGVFY